MLNEPQPREDINSIEKMIRYPRNDKEYDDLCEILYEMMDHETEPELMERVAKYIEQYDELNYPMGE